MRPTLSETLYRRARAAAFQSALAIVAAVAGGVSGILTLPTDGFIAWLLLATSALVMGAGLHLSGKAMRITRLAMSEEESEWRRSLQTFRL